MLLKIALKVLAEQFRQHVDHPVVKLESLCEVPSQFAHFISFVNAYSASPISKTSELKGRALLCRCYVDVHVH